MYEKIRSSESLPVQYSKKLISEGVIKQEKYEKMVNQINQFFEEEFKHSEKIKPNLKDTRDPNFKGSRSLTHKWKSMDFSQNGVEPKETGFNKDKLINIGRASAEVDFSVEPHQRIARMHLAHRLKGL